MSSTHGAARIPVLFVIAALLFAAMTVVSMPSTARAAVGGPVILGGDDLTDHGFRDVGSNVNVDGWLYLERAIENVLPLVTRPGNNGSIAALGSVDETNPSGGAGAAIHYAAQDAGTGVAVTYYNGDTAIDGFFTDLGAGTANPAIIWIAGDGAGNDLDGSEAAALTTNATTIAGFVNGGGGLISHGTEYGWLSALLPGVSTVDGGSFGDLVLTPAGQAAFPGVTDADINAGPWHNHFEGDLGGLGVLATSGNVDDRLGADAAVIIGGAQVVITGGAPSTVQIPAIAVAKSATAANVVAGSSVTYTYQVTNASIDALLSGISVSDDKCAPVSFGGGDADSDGNLQIGETWTYTCTTTLSATTTNTATASGAWRGRTVTATASATVTVGEGGVLAATATPQITLPPTSTIDGQGSSSPGFSLMLVLLGLAGFALVIGFVTPMSERVRRRGGRRRRR